jgi:hypothetical protein
MQRNVAASFHAEAVDRLLNVFVLGGCERLKNDMMIYLVTAIGFRRGARWSSG